MSNNEFPFTQDGCRLVQETVDHADFSVVLKVSIVSHCEKCPSCQKYVQQLANLRTLLISQVVVEAPADFDIKLRQKIAATTQVSTATPWWQWISQPALGATAAALVMIAVLAGIDKFYLPSQNQSTTTVASVPTNPTTEKLASKTDIDNQNLASNENLVGSEIPSTPTNGENTPITNKNQVTQVNNVSNRQHIIRRVITRPNGSAVIGEINVEVKYGSNSSQTLPVSAIVYGARPVVNIDNADSDENKSRATFPAGTKIF